MYDDIESDKQWYDKNSDKLETIYRNIRFLIREVSHINDEIAIGKKEITTAINLLQETQEKKFSDFLMNINSFEKRMKNISRKTNTLDDINAGTEIIGNNFNFLRGFDIELFRRDALIVAIVNKLDETSLEKLQIVLSRFDKTKISDKDAVIVNIIRQLDTLKDSLLNTIFEDLYGEQWKFKGSVEEESKVE